MLGQRLRTKGEFAIFALAGAIPGCLVAIFVVLLGLAFGSFLNVCISRLPRHRSIMRPRSRCPKCGAAIAARDNVPILSWILLRGRCRACGWQIPWRYAAVETATAALFLLCFLKFGQPLESIGMAVLCFLLLGLAVMDAETLRLPDAFTWPGIGLGVVWSGWILPTTRGLRIGPASAPGIGIVFLTRRAVPSGRWHWSWVMALDAALWALVAALVILAFRWLYFAVRGKEGMGIGDAKLMAMIGAWLGPALTLLTLFLGVLAAAVLGVIWITIRGRRGAMTMRLPFGAFLCAAAILSVFAGGLILDWYLRFFR
jgi:leader peptidase (prepilin peptidase) / N-methyltransferase